MKRTILLFGAFFTSSRKYFFLWIIILSLFLSTRSHALLVFYHIPKTAGSALRTLLSYKYKADHMYRVYESKEICPYAQKSVNAPFYFRSEDVLSLDEITLNDFVPRKDYFIYGHIFFRNGYKHFPNSTNITFLRDPLKRIISHEKFWRVCNKYFSSDDDMNNLHLIPPGSPLKTSTNLQTYYLSSYSREDSTISLEQHLESAKKNLEDHFDFVGITEDMETSMKVLYKVLGFEYFSEMPRINYFNPISLEFSEEEKDRICKENWADIELYNFGKNLLLLKKANLACREPVKPSFCPLSEIHFTLDQPFEGSGWGYREISSELPGLFLRTSYKKQAFFDFPLQKKDYTISFLFSAPDKSYFFSLQLEVNGVPIRLQRRFDFPRANFSAVIPENLISDSEKTRFTFIVPELYCPADHGEFLDTRNLGISIARIDIQ